MSNMLGSAALAVLLFTWPAVADAAGEPEEIELGKVYSIHAEAEAGHYLEYFYVGLAKAKGVRLTLSLTKQASTTQWQPNVRFLFDENKSAIDDPKMENPGIQVAGTGAMLMSLGLISANGIRNAQTYKRRLALHQKVNLEMSWATAGMVVVTVDGQDRRQIALPRNIDFSSISASSGTFDVEDMIFRK